MRTRSQSTKEIRLTLYYFNSSKWWGQDLQGFKRGR